MWIIMQINVDSITVIKEFKTTWNNRIVAVKFEFLIVFYISKTKFAQKTDILFLLNRVTVALIPHKLVDFSYFYV